MIEKLFVLRWSYCHIKTYSHTHMQALWCQQYW